MIMGLIFNKEEKKVIVFECFLFIFLISYIMWLIVWMVKLGMCVFCIMVFNWYYINDKWLYLIGYC